MPPRGGFSRIDEIGAGIYRLSAFVPDAAPPAGFTFNHFLFAGDEPLLFHCGKRKMFPLVSAASPGSCRWSDSDGLVSAISKPMNADR
jgi:hypothetical protein